MNSESYKLLCEKIAEKTNIEVVFFKDNDGDGVFEDDGNLHVIRFGLRACFDVGDCQSLSRSRQNARALRVLKLLGIEIVDRDQVLV